MIQKVLKPIRALARWFFGAPFQQLPPEFGETVPPDLRAFEVATEEAQHHPQGSVQPSFSGGSKQTKSKH
jgi:hypothetical protein